MSFTAFRSNSSASVPSRATDGSAGYDITACESKVIPGRGGRALVDTGVAIGFPSDCYCRIAPRSGLAVKHGIDVLAGVVDSDFFPNAIKVVMVNHGDADFSVEPGMRIAQIIFEKIYTPFEIQEVFVDQDVEGEHKGFGSTGV
jgi:dUTP pyrophosphatase